MYENQGWTVQMQKLKRTMWQLPSWRQQPRLASIPLFSRGCQRICSQYEEKLRGLDDSDKVNQQSVACAIIVYFSSRMEAVSTSLDCWTIVDGLLRWFFSVQAWKEGNYAVAEYASHMIMSKDLFRFGWVLLIYIVQMMISASPFYLLTM